MRVYLIYLGTFFLAIYAWSDWFPAAAALVLMMAVLDNPDMPREMLGITGLNLWNFLMRAAVPAWLVGRSRERLRWDMPPLALVMFAAYVSIIVVAFLRLLFYPGPVDFDLSELVGEYFINPLKYLVPALMFYDGARTRSRLLLGLASILAVYVFLAVLVLKWIPMSEWVSGAELSTRAMRRLGEETGFFRTGLSVMLGGASWAVLSVRTLAKTRLRAWTLVLVAGLLTFAMALTGGRGGYLAWACVGLVLSVLRWRIFLVVAPVAVSIVLAVAPGVRGRALQGLSGPQDQFQPSTVDEEALSAGRLKVWPYMLKKVGDAPFVGFGRLGYRRSGLYAFITREVDPTFPHPHNAYIEWLLDNGWLGMAVMLVLYGLVLCLSLILFTDSRQATFVAVGGVAFALVFAQLVGSFTGRYWYPNEETVGMWAAVGLMLRVWVERSRRRRGSADLRRPRAAS